MKVPERHSLVVQCIEIIQQMIENGELVNPLPGERKLATRLQVSRDTLRSALIELDRQKWISSGTQGSRRKILKQTGILPTRHSAKRIGVISPKSLEALPSPMLIEFDSLRSTLANRNISLELLTPPIFDDPNPHTRLTQLINEHPADAWMLYRCTPEIQAWFKSQNLPCIIRGYPQPGIDLPYLDEDWKAGAFHAGNQLLKNGHTEIALLVPHQSLQGLKAAEAGLREAFAKKNPKFKVHVLTENGDKEGVINAIQKGLNAHPKISALVLTRPRQILNSITWLAAHGLKIPDSLSLISLCYEAWLPELFPAISHYQISHTKMATALTRRLTNLLQGIPLKDFATYVIPEAVPGQSIKNLTP